MSYRTQWNLYGKDMLGNALPSEIVGRICEVMEEEADEWHGGYDGVVICAFMTDRSSGYSSVTARLAEHAKAAPDAFFLLECHNTDEDWYQRILYHGDDKEELDGYIAYETPQRIQYDAPAPLLRLVIVLEGGAVQGVFASSEQEADVIIVDRDESKLEGYDEDEKRETREWIHQHLERCASMKPLYGGIGSEPRP